MKVTINGFIHWKNDPYGIDADFHFWPYKSMAEHGYVFVCAHDIEVDVPDNFNPVPSQIAILEEQKAKVRDEFNARIAQLNEQIGKLQALTFDEVKA